MKTPMPAADASATPRTTRLVARRAVRVACLPLLAWCTLSATQAGAADVALLPPVAEQPLRDPWVPPAAQPSSVPAPAEGAALRAQVERKLKAAFDSADTDGSGAITRAQAEAHGLGYIVNNFDAIDQRHAGVVTFDDVRAFMQRRAAAAQSQR